MDDGPIVIAYDGSDSARRAIREAGKLFAQRYALIVTVWEPALELEVDALAVDEMHPPVVDPDAVEALNQKLAARAHRIAESGAELAASAGLHADPLSAHDEGHVAAAIVEVAQARGAAAIVVGSRGLRGLRARLEGSTSNAVLKHSPCPVVVIHDD